MASRSAVKEKFGTLRFHYDLPGRHRKPELDITSGFDGPRVQVVPANPSEQQQIIWEWNRAAEADSAQTCEICGAAAQLRYEAWMRVTCDDCE